MEMTILETVGIVFLAIVVINAVISIRALKFAANNDSENPIVLDHSKETSPIKTN